MLQRLPIALTRVKSGNTPENLLNKIRRITNSLHQAKETYNMVNAKKVYNNTMNSIKLQSKMETIFMNSQNSEPSEPYRLLLNLLDKKNLKRNEYVALSNPNIYYEWKI